MFGDIEAECAREIWESKTKRAEREEMGDREAKTAKKRIELIVYGISSAYSMHTTQTMCGKYILKLFSVLVPNQPFVLLCIIYLEFLLFSIFRINFILRGK